MGIKILKPAMFALIAVLGFAAGYFNGYSTGWDDGVKVGHVDHMFKKVCILHNGSHSCDKNIDGTN